MITIIHLDKFHFDSENLFTLVVTWAWILVYAIVPIVMLIVFIYQVQSTGVVTKGTGLQTWFKIVLTAQGLVMLFLGMGFLNFPTEFISVWPWAQTLLTLRAIGAWLLGLGTAAIQSFLENDWMSIRPAVFSYGIFGALQLINLLRYPDAKNLDWSNIIIWIYVFFLISILLIGIFGVNQSQKQKSNL